MIINGRSYKPGPERVIILSMTEGIPDRRLCYTIEVNDPARDSYSRDTMFFLKEKDRDMMLKALAACERGKPYGREDDVLEFAAGILEASGYLHAAMTLREKAEAERAAITLASQG